MWFCYRKQHQLWRTANRNWKAIQSCEFCKHFQLHVWKLLLKSKHVCYMLQRSYCLPRDEKISKEVGQVLAVISLLCWGCKISESKLSFRGDWCPDSSTAILMLILISCCRKFLWQHAISWNVSQRDYVGMFKKGKIPTYVRSSCSSVYLLT